MDEISFIYCDTRGRTSLFRETTENTNLARKALNAVDFNWMLHKRGYTEKQQHNQVNNIQAEHSCSDETFECMSSL